MDMVQKEHTMNTYKMNTYKMNKDLNAILMGKILYEKANNQEKRLTDVESELKDLRKLIHSDEYKTNDNQFSSNKQNARFGYYANNRIENKRTESRLEIIVSELKDIDDKKLQVQIVGELVDEIKGMLKDIPKQKNNYRRQVLLMFHEALKQNYAKNLFDETQVKALLETARVCSETFVTKERYFTVDYILCNCNLDMMPDLE